jgi:Rrf2 family cysteine metabolism transcriptional repressor
MKLSTKSRYGLRMLIDIYNQSEDAPTTLSSIAQRQNVSVNYLEQVASDFKRAGFIHSLKGAGGGYFLSKGASDIVVADVLKILEGDVRVTDILPIEESLLQEVIRETVYDEINSRIFNIVDAITLKDLIDKHR